MFGSLLCTNPCLAGSVLVTKKFILSLHGPPRKLEASTKRLLKDVEAGKGKRVQRLLPRVVILCFKLERRSAAVTVLLQASPLQRAQGRPRSS